MKPPKFSVDKDFTVSEEKILNWILTILLFCLFSYGFIDAIKNHFQHLQTLGFLALFALGPMILFFIKARRKRIYIRINKIGIYQDEVLLTNWANFLNAYISQRETKFITITDNFQLVVEYVKGDSTKGFRRKIPLTNTQNKSEEDILAAIKFFWKNSKGW